MSLVRTLTSVLIIAVLNCADANLPNLITKPRNFTAVEGADILLPCEVEHIGAYKSGWLKIHEPNSIDTLLTVGHLTIVGNTRYQVRDTSLFIQNVKQLDTGVYTCRVNTEPPMQVTHQLVVKKTTTQPVTLVTQQLNHTTHSNHRISKLLNADDVNGASTINCAHPALIVLLTVLLAN